MAQRTNIYSHYGFAHPFLLSFNDLSLPSGQRRSTIAMPNISAEEYFRQNIWHQLNSFPVCYTCFSWAFRHSVTTVFSIAIFYFVLRNL